MVCVCLGVCVCLVFVRSFLMRCLFDGCFFVRLLSSFMLLSLCCLHLCFCCLLVCMFICLVGCWQTQTLFLSLFVCLQTQRKNRV